VVWDPQAGSGSLPSGRTRDGPAPVEVELDQLLRILAGECPSVVIGDIDVWDLGM